jgi:hypothetical protein
MMVLRMKYTSAVYSYDITLLDPETTYWADCLRPWLMLCPPHSANFVSILNGKEIKICCMT